MDSLTILATHRMTSTFFILIVGSIFIMNCLFSKNVNALRLKFGKSVMSSSFGLHMKTDVAPVRVRFAPSPTGSLHVGGARTALYNWLLAKKTNGKFLIRVEDTDEARSTRESEQSILNDLKWMNMNWDEGPEIGGDFGPYRQSERKDIYKVAADKLLEKGVAYRCFCTEDELSTKRAEAEAKGADPKYDGTWRDRDPAEIQQKLDNGDPYTVRFKVPAGKIVSIDDMVRGRVSWDAEATLGDFIILRSNGMPVYNFCVSVDDAGMQITHVVRAEEHLTNTLRQMLILEALEYTPPAYAHCSLILGSDRQKMSKRHGATSVQQFGDQGFIPDAMMNYLANLGWNDGTDKEIYTPEELIDAFDLRRIVKSGAVFDMDKLKWINQQHLKVLPIEKMKEVVTDALCGSNEPLLTKASVDSLQSSNPKLYDNFITAASKIAQRDMVLTTDTNWLVGNCLKYDLDASFSNDAEEVKGVLANPELGQVVAALIRDGSEGGAMPKGMEDDFTQLWKTYMKDLGKELGLKGKNLFHPVRLLLTSRMSGPDVGDQLRLTSLAAASGLVERNYPIVPLSVRIDALKEFSVTKAL